MLSRSAPHLATTPHSVSGPDPTLRLLLRTQGAYRRPGAPALRHPTPGRLPWCRQRRCASHRVTTPKDSHTSTPASASSLVGHMPRFPVPPQVPTTELL